MNKHSPLRFILPLFLLVGFTFLYVYWNDIPMWFQSQALASIPADIRFLIGTVSWAFFAFCINRLTQVILWEGWFRARTGRSVPGLLQSIFGATLYLLAATAIVSLVFDRDPKFLLAATGGAGIVVGFALQSMIADFFAGIVLTVQRPFGIGDWVTVGDESGNVHDISWRATQLLDPNSRMVTLPNSKVLGGRIINANHAVALNNSVEIVLGHDMPIKDAVTLLNKAAVRSQPTLPGKEPKVVTLDVGEQGVRYRVQFWIPDKTQVWSVKQSVLEAIQDDLNAAGYRYARSLVHNPSSRLEAASPGTAPGGDQ